MSWYELLLLLCVASNALAAAELRDIRGPLALAGTPPFIVSGGMLLLLGGLFLLQRRLRLRRRRHDAAAPPPPAAPRADAGDLLARLFADYQQGNCPGDQLVIRLDAIVRGGLAASRGIPAQRRTSAELREAATTCLNEAARVRLDELLLLCDRVKFAGHQPSQGEVEAALRGAASLLAGLPEGRGA